MQLGMVAALPVQDRVNDRTVPTHDDLREGRERYLAVQAGCKQAAFQTTERHQVLALRLAERWRTTRNQGGELSFDPSDNLRASFQRRSNSPATRRFAGSTASYCRRATAASCGAKFSSSSSIPCLPSIESIFLEGGRLTLRKQVS